MNQRVQQVDFPYENLLSVGFHSKYNNETYPIVGNVPILPLRTDYRGPAATLTNGKRFIYKIGIFIWNYS